MYERFTDRARKVMQLANQESHRFRHEYIGTEHILLGLVAEGSGIAANVLLNLDISLTEVRRQVDQIVQCGPSEVPPAARLPQTPRAQKVIEYAVEEARNLNHNYVGTEHLLLGLLREPEGVAAEVLRNLGLNLADVREEVLNLLGHNLPDLPPGDAFRIPKSLEPEAEAAAPFPVSDEQWDAPTAPPDLTGELLELVKERIRLLNEQKEEFVGAQEFAKAVNCRDEVEALKRLLRWYSWARRTH
jgi:ATP-dependent Clp protease ATP-binding subunit ClpA